MLTDYDIIMMEDSVRDIIKMWNTKLSVLKPLPIEEQPNWNIHLHEYNGEIHYTRFNNVAFERKDQMNTNIYDFDIKSGAGDDRDGYLVFTTSDLNTFIDSTCRILYNDEQWRVDQIRQRIGEKILLLYKIVGSDERWSQDPDIIIDMDADNDNEDDNGDDNENTEDGDTNV